MPPLRLHALSLLTATLLLTACGPSSFKDLCEQSVNAQCRQLFRCDASLAGRQYTDVAGCQSALLATANCGQFDALSCTLDRAAAATCISDIEKAECRATFELPSSCRSNICQAADAGSGVSCSRETGGSSSSNTGTTCSNTFDRCSDGKTYGLSCSGSTCSCTIDGVEVKSIMPTPTNCSQTADVRAIMKNACEFPLR